MGKLTFNGKDITKPFTYNGKQVVSLTYNGKVCTLQSACHSFPNGFEYCGTWGTDAKSQTWLTYLSTLSPGATLSSPPGAGSLSGMEVTSLTLPWANVPNYMFFALFKLETVNLPSATSIGHHAFGNSPVATLNCPLARSIGERAFWASVMTSLNLPEITRLDIGAFGTNWLLTSIDAPKLHQLEGATFSKSAKITHLDFSSLGLLHNAESTVFPAVINAPSTTVTLRNGDIVDSYKDRLFGAGNWDKITFTLV